MGRLVEQRLTPKRSCGGCTACCTLTAVPELQKPVNVTCAHCSANSCLIYRQRPQSCRDFECAWLRGDLPDWMRPDKIGMMVERLPGNKVVLALPTKSNWRTKDVEDELKRIYQANGVAVATRVADKIFSLLPDGMTSRDVEREVGAFARSIGAM